ncbi:UPF0280 family protein [Falsiroseomonas ponticola]|uniref:UPF0280 family protein n=1 Tax=Falsiroseomonas ponticola TaxID=2786951 RepID=UPI0019339769|nr:UPF0280 family protein [Roseomonas ponticola]
MQAARLADGRLHLNHGPIDLVLRTWGSGAAAAEQAALACFPSILPALVAELPLLRQPVGAVPAGAVARRMHAACAPYGARGLFITPMAAVAGSVADELLAVMRAAAPGLTRAFVNNGGDIAVFAAAGESLAIGLALDPRLASFDGALRVRGGDGVGGIATSGRHGRSFSMGIADAVTVLARDAAAADAAATLIANAVDCDSPAVTRAPADSLDPDSDLGARLVTTAVGPLAEEEVARALDSGAATAASFLRDGLIIAAALRLAGRSRILGRPFAVETPA